MPVHRTIDPVEAATKAVDALLAAIAGSPGLGAVAAYKAALRRHGRNLVATAGPEALGAVLTRIRADAGDEARAGERARLVSEAWDGITGAKDRAA